MTLSKKLLFMYALAFVALFGACAMLLQAKRHASLEERSAATRHLVEAAHGVLVYHEALSAKGTVTRAEAQAAAIAAIKALRYEEKEYFWINDMHPRMVMHPIKPELDGKDLSEAKDPDGKRLFVEFVKTVQQSGQGFVPYLWPKPGMDKPVPKISFVKGFAPWGWVIGSGIYIDDVDAEFRQDVARYGGAALLIALVLGVMFWLLARSITGPLKHAVKIADAVSAGDMSQVIEVKGGGESAQLMAAMAKMQGNLRERLEADRRTAEEMARIKLALDVGATPVRIADNDGKIIYINNKLREILRRDEAAFREAAPGFDASKVEGGSIGMFYADPGAAIERLRQLEQSATAMLVLGGRDYEVTTTPVRSPDGARLGTIGQWVDRTEQLAAEKELKEIVAAASVGNFTRRVAVEGKDGFFLHLAQDLNGLLQTSDKGLAEVSRVLGALAHGDLTAQIHYDYQGTYSQLKADFNTTVANLIAIVHQIKEASDTIDTASQEITHGNTDLSQRTEEQASSLEETASSMEELTSTVQQNAEHARKASQLAMNAADVAVQGGAVVKQVVDTMSGISDSSKRIADIIGTIDGIAFQTNILALNASVEAARAGEQGRGFAVVASEVRNLAQRSATAAKEIRGLIADSVRRVDAGGQLVEQAGKTMDDVVAAVGHVADIISEISAASQEQSTGIEQVNQAITQMDEVTQQNAALVEEAAAAAESMQEQSAALVRTVGAFKLGHGMQQAMQDKSDGGDRAARVMRLPSRVRANRMRPLAQSKKVANGDVEYG